MATLIGDGGHARDIWGTRGSLEGPSRWTPWIRVPHHEAAKNYSGEVYIGINDPQVRAQVSRAIFVEDAAWKHPYTYISDSTWDYGTHINYGVTMTRTTIGHHTTISPGVTICGDVTIGNRVFIGAGATIKNLVTIGDDAFIRMGSIVTRDVEAGERY